MNQPTCPTWSCICKYSTVWPWTQASLGTLRTSVDILKKMGRDEFGKWMRQHGISIWMNWNLLEKIPFLCRKQVEYIQQRVKEVLESGPSMQMKLPWWDLYEESVKDNSHVKSDSLDFPEDALPELARYGEPLDFKLPEKWWQPGEGEIHVDE